MHLHALQTGHAWTAWRSWQCLHARLHRNAAHAAALLCTSSRHRGIAITHRLWSLVTLVQCACGPASAVRRLPCPASSSGRPAAFENRCQAVKSRRRSEGFLKDCNACTHIAQCATDDCSTEACWATEAGAELLSLVRRKEAQWHLIGSSPAAFRGPVQLHPAMHACTLCWHNRPRLGSFLSAGHSAP